MKRMYESYTKHRQIIEIDDTIGAVYCVIGLFVFMVFHIVGVF